MALTPVSPTLSNLTSTSFKIDVNADGNPAPPATYYAFEVTANSETKYVNSGGTLQDTKIFLPVLSITVTSVTPNTLHSVRLSAADDVSGTNESSIGPATAATTLAASPLSSAYSAIFSTTITANWSANGNPSGTEYEVELSTDPNFLVNVTNSGFITDTSYIFSNLSPQTTYYGRVRARNSVGALTSYVSLGSTVTLEGPDTVKVIRVLNLLTERGYLITWQPNQETDISHYRVYRSESPTDVANFELLQDNIPTNVTSHIDKVPYTFGIVFYYSVTAVDTDGNESSLALTTPAHENTFHSFEEQPFPTQVQARDFVTDEEPQGDVDGVNVAFTTAFPYRANSLEVWLNGNKMIPLVDFVEGPLSQQFTFLDPPNIGGFVRVNYKKIG